jgi:hypothetical protein
VRQPRRGIVTGTRRVAEVRPFRPEALSSQFHPVPDAAPPFAPARASFPCPALLSLAARATLGGARESLLGAVMAVRLVEGLRSPHLLPAPAREARAEGARQWLGALTLPAKARTALLRAYATSAADDLQSAADAMAAVTEVTSPHLDKGARLELVRLADALRAEAPVLAGVRDRPVA